jgi:hypothetical protein
MGNIEYETRNRQRASAVHWQMMRTHWQLIAALSDALTDEGANWSNDGLDSLRSRVANVLPPDACPDWLLPYRGQSDG